MTTPPFLPETDLARIAPMPLDQKRKALESFQMGWPPYSYAPVRASFGDLINLDTGLFGALDSVPFERIAQVIREASRHQKEVDANLRVAAGLYAENWRGRRQPFGTMSTTIGQRLTYWAPVVVDMDGRPVVPFFNPRRDPLPRDGVRFAMSMMHQQIRVANPDYEAVGLCVCHFANPKTGPRPARPILDSGVGLYSFEELQDMVAETYAIWAEVWARRLGGTRRRASGGDGPGFGF